MRTISLGALVGLLATAAGLVTLSVLGISGMEWLAALNVLSGSLLLGIEIGRRL